jgi:SAM-dependent methyltransferase
MGITKLSLDRIERYIQPNSNILIVGCQNMYDNEHYGQVAQLYFESLGHKVKSIDIIGCQGADIADLRDDLKFNGEFDLVLQHGTVEHCDGNLRRPFKNFHEACKIGGVMIYENPMTGNWPGHGYHYFTTDFYVQLASSCDYEVMELASEPAMGNTTDGWNVCCVLRKTGEYFPDKYEFDGYDLRAK